MHQQIDLPTTNSLMLFKPSIAKCIVDSFVVSICLGELAVVYMTLLKLR